MADCVFCKIIKGEIPSIKVYEDKDTIAILDIHPINPGHTLVMTREHYETIGDVPDSLLQELMLAVKKIATGLKKMADGVNVNQNNRREAGQIIDHIHFHVIPRMKGDGLKHWPGKSYKEGEAEELAKKIKSLL